jgi:hypothetical protein
MCDHIFTHQGKKRLVCPKCLSLYAEEVDETSVQPAVTAVSPVQSEHPIAVPEPGDLDERAQEINEQLRNAFGFSPEDQAELHRDILADWKSHIQQEIALLDNYARTAKSLDPKVKDIVAALEALAGKLPSGWDEYLSSRLQATPPHFRDLERTRRGILREWKLNLDQFEAKFGQEWTRVIGELDKIDQTYKGSILASEQAAQPIRSQLEAELEEEQSAGLQREQKRHEDWLREHIQQVLEREILEHNRQAAWNERFSSPRQLWLVMREEWRLAQERRRQDLSRQRSRHKDKLRGLQNWFETKKQFYFNKLQSWSIALQEVGGDGLSSDGERNA